MCTNEKDGFIFIDGLEGIMKKYGEILHDDKTGCHHAILFHGETGSGKEMFSSHCINVIKALYQNIIVIDLLNVFKGSNKDSGKKMEELLETIEDELVENRGYSKLKNKSKNQASFRRNLEKILQEKEAFLLLRLPQLEVFEEFEKYYNTLYVENIVLYFVTEKNQIVDKCKNEYEGQMEFYKCGRLKKGDGKRYIMNVYSKDDIPKFIIEDIEWILENRPAHDKMTIKELKSLCYNVYKYAIENNIEIIDKSTILAELASRSRI